MISTDHIQELWERMSKIYGHRWVSSYGESDDGTWETGLSDLSAAQLATGLKKCINRNEGWPPSLPEFRNMCLDLLDKELVIMKVLNGAHNDPITMEIVSRIGSWDMSHMNEKQMRKAAGALYEISAKSVVGEMLALEDQG